MEAVAPLSFRSLSVTFSTDSGPVAAVEDVSFDVKPGEVLAVVGESGSGKSVSSRAAIRLLPETARITGSVLLDGRDVTTLSGRELTAMRGKDIAMVFQEPGAALDPLFTIGYQVGEAVRAHAAMTRTQARARVLELLALVQLPDPERRYDCYPHQLSGGQKQRVVIAIAIACDPKVIIADEPTTALDVTVQAEILELLRDLRDRIGSSIVLITHNMGVVADIADRVVVMKQGRVVEIAPVEQLFAAPAEPYTRALLAAVPHLGQGDPEHAPAESGDPAEPVLEVSHLVVEFPGPLGRSSFRAVDDVSFSIGRGKTLGLVGESGSGKSTIGRCVAALQPPASGSVRMLGQEIVGMSQRKLRPLRARFGFVFQDPATSLNPKMRVGDCIAEPMWVHRYGDRHKILSRVAELVDAVQLPAGTENRYPHELSGGQRQRANLARALALSPDLLVADEPTSALDVSVQAAVLDLFEELQQQWQFACLFISHDLAVVDRLADEVAVLRHGVLEEMGPRGQILHNPSTEYTRALVAAVPVPDPLEQRERQRARRSVPPR
ncbi:MULTISPECIES: ABC transporter ATP-binding protein [unclassified Mycobacteroides]|uniref:ABC transporter ATP-binding protein n=1 Tax=unclassified Mycobacteroides TaxID=2618759 RepID=UPI0012DBF937